ncbi:hypothetical protein ACLMJK_002578 [Lecanora helva]
MVQYFPPPDCRSLLPPLLACLPTAFVSPHPPPALLPLLTPILRQRIQYLAANATSSSDSWLPLLCWETEPAQRLVDIISDSDAFELHPVSGEIDYGDLEEIRYRRLDQETLQARIIITDLSIIVIYQWCDADQEGDNGWRVSEVRPADSENDTSSNSWFLSVTEAGENTDRRMMDDAIRQGEDNSVPQGSSLEVPAVTAAQGDDNEDDYWAQYDKTGETPARTPAAKSPNPSGHIRSTSEAEYYAQYAQVQPEMDNNDPSQTQQSFGESTLNGNTMLSSLQQANHSSSANIRESLALPNGSGIEDPNRQVMNQPIPSPPKTGSSTISKFETSAESQFAVSHHVSTSIKSLYRLCRSSGIAREEFERMVRNEIDTLGMMDEDD